MTARLAPVDNFYVKFHREILQKEIMTQLKWYHTSGLALIDKQLDLLRDRHVRAQPTIKKESEELLLFPPTEEERERKAVLYAVAQTKRQLKDIVKVIIRTDPKDQTQMPAPDPELRALLYKGVSANGEGRISYLKERNRLAPMNRYNFNPLTLWSHGWLQDKFPKERLPMSDVPLPHRLRAIFRKNGLLHPEEDVFPLGCQTRNWI